MSNITHPGCQASGSGWSVLGLPLWGSGQRAVGGGGWADRHICTEAVPCTRGEGSWLPLNAIHYLLSPPPAAQSLLSPLSVSHPQKEIKAELGEGGAF